MKELIKFEWKKTWQSPLTILAIVALLFICITLNLLSLSQYDFPRESSQSKIIDYEYLTQIVEELDLNEDNIDMIYWSLPPNHPFLAAIPIISFASIYNEGDFEDMLASEDAFYEQYKKSLSVNTQSSNNWNWFQYTEEQMERITERINHLQTPLQVSSNHGITFFLLQYNHLYILVLVIIAFLLSSLFAEDSPQGIDELTLALKYSRKKDFNARIITGNLLAITIYTIFIGCLLIQSAFAFSLQGWNQSIQSLASGAFYNMRVGTGVMMVIFDGLLTVLLMANLIMLISIIIKKAKLATIISVAILGGLVQLGNTTHPLYAQLNPIFFATRRFGIGANWGFEFYLFIGNLMIPYTVAFIILSSCYFIIIRYFTIRQYKRYTLN